MRRFWHWRQRCRNAGDGQGVAPAQTRWSAQNDRCVRLTADHLGNSQKNLSSLTDTEVILATGERKSARLAVEKRLRPGADREPLIALCSGLRRPEGVNLQAASAVVHLDLPSVVRIAEQRVGRVDRMDSPNTFIEAWWPQDAPELALRSDERFIERYETVESLLGSNLPLPKEMGSSDRHSAGIITADQAIQEFAEEQSREPWDGLRDVFAPVRELVDGLRGAHSEGRLRTLSEGLRTRPVASQLVQADKPWALVCFTGSSIGAPRWVFVQDSPAAIMSDLAEITSALRERLGPGTQDLEAERRKG